MSAERPILFNGAMVRAILSGAKTQTRRVVAGVLGDNCLSLKKPTKTLSGVVTHVLDAPSRGLCPFGQPGDRLWVRETWMPGYYHEADHEDGPKVSVIYRADNAELALSAPSVELAEQWERDFSDDGDDAPPARPSIHMPRWASRLVLEITDVRVERLQAISEADALAEGAMEWAREQNTPIRDLDTGDERVAFMALWSATGGDWDSNPWVWVVEFKRVEVQGG